VLVVGALRDRKSVHRPLPGIMFGRNGCAPVGDHMTKLITNYPLAALILIWTALIGVICILPGTDTTVVAHNLLDGN